MPCRLTPEVLPEAPAAVWSHARGRGCRKEAGQECVCASVSAWHAQEGPRLLGLEEHLCPFWSRQLYWLLQNPSIRSLPCSVRCHSPILVVRAFLVEAFIVGLHVAQAGVVIGVNEGQMNLEAEKAAAGIRTQDLGKKSASQG